MILQFGFFITAICAEYFFSQMEQIICLKMNATQLFSSGCAERKYRAIAYGGCVICGHKITMVWLLTPAPVVQHSSEISEREPSLHQLRIPHPACLVFGVWWVWGVSQASLPFAHVPVQALGQALEPIVNQVVATDGGHRVAGCGDLDAAEDKWQRQGTGARKETAVDCNGQMVTSPQTGSPVSSCRQTTPRQCSWPQGTGWSNGDWRGRQSQSRPTDKHRHADFPTLTVDTHGRVFRYFTQEVTFLWGLIQAENSEWTSEAWWWRYGTIFFVSKNTADFITQRPRRLQMCWPNFVCDKPKSQLASIEATEKL